MRVPDICPRRCDSVAQRAQAVVDRTQSDSDPAITTQLVEAAAAVAGSSTAVVSATALDNWAAASLSSTVAVPGLCVAHGRGTERLGDPPWTSKHTKPRFRHGYRHSVP